MKHKKLRPLYYALGGMLYALLLLFLAFVGMRQTEVLLVVAKEPFVLGPALWPLAFMLAANLRDKVRRTIFVLVLCSHYLGLIYSLITMGKAEWGFPYGTFIVVIILLQMMIYFSGQRFLWGKFIAPARAD